MLCAVPVCGHQQFVWPDWQNTLLSPLTGLCLIDMVKAGIGGHKTFQNMKLSKPSGSGDLTYKSCNGLLNDQNTCRKDCKWWMHEILRKHLRRWQRQWLKLFSRRNRSGETPFWPCLGKKRANMMAYRYMWISPLWVHKCNGRKVFECC